MKLKKDSIPRQIADHLEMEIKQGKYQLGDKLPTEPELAAFFGVSRNTLREAVQSLIHAGVLSAQQGRGTFVVAKERLQVDFCNLLAEVDRSEILEIRTLLELYSVVTAIEKATDEDIERIETAFRARLTDIEHIKEFTQTDIEFHLAIAAAAHNQLLLKMYQYVSGYVAEFVSATLHKVKPDELALLNQLHSDLMDAIRARDAEAAKKAVHAIVK